jgi:secreted trypsin-like serine protease
MKVFFFIALLLVSLVVLVVVLTRTSRSSKPVSATSGALIPLLPPVKRYDTSTCYVRPPSRGLRIYRGTEAGPQYPFVGALKYRDVYLCGLSLVAPLWCLGAAHCISYLSDMTVTVGRFDLDLVDVGQVRNIVEFHAHPRFNTSTFEADIALFKMDQPIDDIRPICLPVNGITDREEYLVVGWGATENAAATTRLQQVTVYPAKDCLMSSEETVCAINNIILGGPCLGDSGGPLFHLDEKTQHYVIDGVVSRGASRCVSSPTSFTRVASYIDWILATI